MSGGRCPPPDPPAGRPTPAAYDLEIDMSAIACAALSGLLLLPLAYQGPGAAVRDATQRASGEGLTRPVPWTRRHVEHLFNRAGFGAREGDIQWALKIGPEALVDQLLDGGRSAPPPHYEQGRVEDLDRGNDLPRAQKRRLKAEWSRADREQLATYAGWWIDRMVRHDDPLRDRMTLLWHGVFATEHRKVKRSFDVIQQHQLLRENAIENYGDLLRGIVVDPAMIDYLDNSKNRKGRPNENLARELMELFSLGEGHYSEQDVKEVARALTGHSRDRIGNYRFHQNHHDTGRKTVLGETGKFRAGEVIDILLEQTACSRYVAGRILAFLEGVEPDELRLVEYAAHLKLNDYELRPFLRKLMLDPRFYRDEVVGARVSGPIDYLVGSVRRLGLEVDSEFIFQAGDELGQRLFDPPSVKGWTEGEAWVTTGSLFSRGNTIGLLLGTVELSEHFVMKGNKRKERGAAQRRGETMESMEDTSMEGSDMEGADMEDEAMTDGEMMGEMAMIGAVEDEPLDKMPKDISRLLGALGEGYSPSLNLGLPLRRRGVVGDERVTAHLLENLLAIEPPPDTRARLARWLAHERERLGLSEEEFLARADESEPLLRRLAHLILSLPEAQLG